MASNQLTDEERKKIRGACDKLFTRALHFYPCPLSNRLAVRNLYYSMFDEEIIHAQQLLQDEGYNLHSLTTYSFKLVFHEHIVVFRMDDHPEPGPHHVLKPMPKRPACPLSFANTGTTLDVFLEWVHQVGSLDFELIDARSTLERAMRLANTPGQLKRMIPGIENYMPPSVQNRMGSRASAVALEWSSRNDPADANRLSTLLAKCYLMPPIESNDTFDATLQSKTWVRRKSVSPQL